MQFFDVLAEKIVITTLKNRAISAEKLISLAKKGVQARPYLPSIHLSEAYKKKYKYKEGDFPISEKVSSQTIALPLYVQMTKKDVTEISQRLISIIKKYE